jgi:hypothetical protein
MKLWSSRIAILSFLGANCFHGRFPCKRESSLFKVFCTPAFAGATVFLIFAIESDYNHFLKNNLLDNILDTLLMIPDNYSD